MLQLPGKQHFCFLQNLKMSIMIFCSARNKSKSCWGFRFFGLKNGKKKKRHKKEEENRSDSRIINVVVQVFSHIG